MRCGDWSKSKMFGFKKKKKTKKEKNSFIGFVLLEKPVWDRKKLVQDLLEDWEIDISKEEISVDDEFKDIILAQIGKMQLAISFIPSPVPNEEAEYYASINYMWKDAVEITKKHTAQIMIVVLGDEKVLEMGKLFTKASASCLKQHGALAIYSDGAVYEPRFYIDFSTMMKNDELPLFNWIWFGVYQDETQRGVYTYGMKKFGKDEMEVYVTSQTVDLNKVRDFMVSMVGYVLEYDVELKDGETIGFSAEQKLAITKSKGIALDGQTLKIEYGEE